MREIFEKEKPRTGTAILSVLRLSGSQESSMESLNVTEKRGGCELSVEEKFYEEFE